MNNTGVIAIGVIAAACVCWAMPINAFAKPPAKPAAKKAASPAPTPPPAPAPAPAATVTHAPSAAKATTAKGGNPREVVRQESKIEFDERMVQGQRAAGAIYLFNRGESEFRSMVSVPDSFTERTIKTILPEGAR